ncbi:hypothetical protein [Thiothrix winogradskyi]|uniref:Oligosaccharide repeat unit polymerase n=1 Tax=Thiothrix winogradskyi TaxID=96472 RepID=A0ABY3SZV4_9GAMM|nr:hypothetical protein [Thiothrix winogradskyi]UJS24290.1 hypothetical protein L2Y54_20530 [Thiothrix winogradskyi]
MGKNYTNYYEYYYEKKETAQFSIELLLLITTAIPKFISLCLGFFLFESLRRKYKYYFILFIILIILSQTVSGGNQKSLGDIFIIGSIAATIRLYKINARKRRKIISAIATAFIILFLIFSYSQYSRLDARDISASDINNYMAAYSSFNVDHPIFSLLGDKMGLGVSAFITGYLSGGYYGLSQCLTLPFEWTYGIGNSVALSSFTELLFSTNIYEQTYLYRMEETFGIPGKRAWHTIFPWLASDVSFFGIPPLFVMISYFYGKSWKEVIIYKNPISLLLFSLLSILFIFVVANNQILHGYDYLLITFFVITIYIFKHKKFNIK